MQYMYKLAVPTDFTFRQGSQMSTFHIQQPRELSAASTNASNMSMALGRAEYHVTLSGLVSCLGCMYFLAHEFQHREEGKGKHEAVLDCTQEPVG